MLQWQFRKNFKGASLRCINAGEIIHQRLKLKLDIVPIINCKLVCVVNSANHLYFRIMILS